LKKKYDYTKEDIVNKLKEVNIKKGDCVFIHSNLGFFGNLKDVDNAEKLCQYFVEAIFDVIGENGTLIVPTFSLSFCNNQIFDKENTPSFECGIFSEYIRNKKDAKRSNDANFSVSAIGFKSETVTSNMPEHSFGNNSFWERLLSENGKICRFNMNSDYNTFIHFVEKKNNVSYRTDKEFLGISIKDGQKIKRKNIHFVRDLDNDGTSSDLKQLDNKLEEKGLLHSTSLGRGQIITMSSKDVFNVSTNELKKNSSFLIKDGN
jgi:aminoglycoside 3-N-acetyltransferase